MASAELRGLRALVTGPAKASAMRSRTGLVGKPRMSGHLANTKS